MGWGRGPQIHTGRGEGGEAPNTQSEDPHKAPRYGRIRGPQRPAIEGTASRKMWVCAVCVRAHKAHEAHREGIVYHDGGVQMTAHPDAKHRASTFRTQLKIYQRHDTNEFSSLLSTHVLFLYCSQPISLFSIVINASPHSLLLSTHLLILLLCELYRYLIRRY